MKRRPARVNAKGQVVIPAELRRRLGIVNGTELVMYEEEGRLVASPVDQLLAGLHGALKGSRQRMREFLQERRRDDRQ